MNNGSTSRSVQRRIVILGGGFAGVYAALHLEKLLAHRPEVEICLVSRDNFFLFTPMLHEIAASDLEITNIVNPLRKLLRRVKSLSVRSSESICQTNRWWFRTVTLRMTSTPIAWSTIISCSPFGSITNFFNLPGLSELALAMKSLPDAISQRPPIAADVRGRGRFRRRRNGRGAKQLRTRGAPILSQSEGADAAGHAVASRGGDPSGRGDDSRERPLDLIAATITVATHINPGLIENWKIKD
jgi:hypothetical protein